MKKGSDVKCRNPPVPLPDSGYKYITANETDVHLGEYFKFQVGMNEDWMCSIKHFECTESCCFMLPKRFRLLHKFDLRWIVWLSNPTLFSSLNSLCDKSSILNTKSQSWVWPLHFQLVSVIEAFGDLLMEALKLLDFFALREIILIPWRGCIIWRRWTKNVSKMKIMWKVRWFDFYCYTVILSVHKNKQWRP